MRRNETEHDAPTCDELRAPISAVLRANAVKAAVLAAVGKGVPEGFVTVSTLALLNKTLAGMVWMKRVLMAAVVISLAVGGLAWAKYAAAPAESTQQFQACVTQPEAPARADVDGAPGSEPRVDRHGDPLPDAAVSRLGTLRFNHGGRLNSLFFSPDGKTIVSEGSGKIRLWDATSGKELREIVTGESTSDDHAVLLPDGKRLMILRQENLTDAIRVWSLADGKEVETLPLPVRRGGADVWHRNALSPDGRFCAVSLPKQIRVFEIATAKVLWTLPNSELEKATLITFAGKDKLVTADHNGVVQLWEAATGKLDRQFNLGSKVGVLAATIDGSRLATLEHHNYAIDRYLDKDLVHIWDLTSGKELQTLVAPPKSWFMKVQFAPDGKTIFTSCFTEKSGSNAASWDVATGKQIAVLGSLYPLAVSPDGMLVAVGAAKFNLIKLSDNAPVNFAEAKSAWARDVFLSPTGEHAFTHGHFSMSAWESASGGHLHSSEIPKYQSSLPRAKHSLDGRYAAVFEGDYKSLKITIWDVAAKKPLRTLAPPSADQSSKVSFSPDSSLVAIYQPKWLKEATVTIWDIASGKELGSLKETKTFAGHSGVPYFSVDNKSLMIAGRNVVGLNIATGQELFTWRMEPSPSSGMKTSAGGKPVEQEDPSAWRALAISPDGAVAGGILWGDGFGSRRTENRIVLCDGRTGRILGRMDDSGKATPDLEAVSFSSDGRLFATTDNAVVHLWEVATRKEIRRLDGHRGNVTSVAFSLNGRRLATSSGDTTCLIWDIGRIVNADQPPTKPPAGKQIAAWWDDLLSAEPRTGYAAIWRLSESSKESIPFLGERVRPVTKEQANQVEQHVTDLESETFLVRQRASQALHELGRLVEPTLRRAIEKNPKLESRRRLEQLLNGINNGPTAGEPLRLVRAIAVLEYTATPEARRLLESLARGAEGALMTEEARKAGERLRLQSRAR